MIRGLYDWTIHQAESPYALWVLAVVAFAESSFFPIPPDVLMIPMILAAPHRAFLIAGVALAASVVGGMFGYMIGAFAFDAVGQPILDLFHAKEAFEGFKVSYNEWGIWIVLTAGVTPIPYKVFTIASGTVGMNFVAFVLASVVARGLRFYIVAGLLWKFGAPIRGFIERRLGILFTVFIVLLIGSFFLVGFFK